MASYEDMLKLEEVTDYSQISNALKELIATTEDLQNARVFLNCAVGKVLKNGAKLLGMDMPEKM